MNKTVGIIGLGLLGASLAMALQAYTDYEVVGYARRQEICQAALRDACVSQAWTDVDSLILNSDIIVFALPPDTNADLFAQKAHLFKPGQVVTDVSSSKGHFVQSVYEHIPQGVTFVSIHPMAGSEKGGYEMASKDLFQSMGWIVLDDPEASCYDAAVADELAHMGLALGSRLERVSLAEHDAYLASVSHMPHLLASILCNVVGDDDLGRRRMSLSAGGFRDCTRVAGGHPGMWREIMMGNRQNIRELLGEVAQEIEKVRDILARGDEDALETYLAHAKEVRDTLPTITGKKG